eukprot:gene9030-biopygen13158
MRSVQGLQGDHGSAGRRLGKAGAGACLEGEEAERPGAAEDDDDDGDPEHRRLARDEGQRPKGAGPSIRRDPAAAGPRRSPSALAACWSGARTRRAEETGRSTRDLAPVLSRLAAVLALPAHLPREHRDAARQGVGGARLVEPAAQRGGDHRARERDGDDERVV